MDSPQTSPAAPLPERLGRFKVLEALEAGTEAPTLLAVDPDSQKRVVLKRIVAAVTPAQQEAVIREGQALARVHSPYVARCLGAERLDGVPTVVTEYIAGKSLAETIRARSAVPRAALKLMEQVAEGAAAIHVHGLRHLAIKPAHILVDENGTPHLAGFGTPPPPQEPGQPWPLGSGSPAYLAPEQARGDLAHIDARTDVFGLGAVLYALLTNRPPYTGGTRDEVIAQAQQAQIKPPRQLNPAVPRALEKICLKAMAADPDQRYRTASDFQQALVGLQQQRQRRTRWMGAIGLLILFLSLASGRFFRHTPPEPVRPAVPRPASVTLPLRVDLEVGVGTSDGQPTRTLGEPETLPVHRGEHLYIEGRSNQPAFLYLFLIDSAGNVRTLYPEQPEAAAGKAPTEPALTIVHSPEGWERGWSMAGPSGLQTIVLLARRTPLPAEVRVADVLRDLPRPALDDSQAFTLVAFDDAQPARTLERIDPRNPDPNEPKIDAPLKDVMNRLHAQFEAGRAMRFAYSSK